MSATQSSTRKSKIHFGNLIQGLCRAETCSKGSSLSIVGERSCDKANGPDSRFDEVTKMRVYGPLTSCKPTKRGSPEVTRVREVFPCPHNSSIFYDNDGGSRGAKRLPNKSIVAEMKMATIATPKAASSELRSET